LWVRISLGIVFAQSGLGKLNNFERTTDFFHSLGIPLPGFHAVFIGWVELIAGGLLVLGLGTRVAALLLSATMAVALLTSGLPGAEGLLDSLTLDETLYLGVLLWLLLAGPGRVSSDHLLKRNISWLARFQRTS
jgi:putative oxidoreductase